MASIMPPAFLLARLNFIFSRMQAVGLLEPVIVFGMQVQTDSAGKPVAREREPLATFGAYISPSSGMLDIAQEGERVLTSHLCYYLPDPSLTEDNHAQRWAQLPNRSQRLFRVTTVQPIGALYSWAMLEAGGVADKAGNIR